MHNRINRPIPFSASLSLVRIFDLAQIRQVLDYPAIIDRMREALIAYSRGESDTPMPMHLNVANNGEVHMKSAYRRGGPYFALKIAATIPGQGGNGMVLLSSAETAEPLAFFADGGHLTDVRTAAVAALVTRELGRTDTVLGILGTGIQARLLARMHAEILDLAGIVIWGRSHERAEHCARELRDFLPDAEIFVVDTPAEVALRARLICTATGSRKPLLRGVDLQPGTHVSAVGSDSLGKQELDPEILDRAALLLVDSRRQCETLGELQHAPDQRGRTIEIGEFCVKPSTPAPGAITVCDFTGLGVEDLYIAEYCYERAL